MNVRAIGMAVALLAAAACRTSGSQPRPTGGTAQAPSSDTATSPSTTAQAPPAEAGTSTTAQAPDTGASASSQPGQDPLVEPGPAIKAHASDRIVSGQIREASESSVTISSQAGDRRILEIAPETTITVDGMEAGGADLEEGRAVRASYNEVDGRQVAVRIEVGEDASSEALEPKELGVGATTGSSPSDTSSSSGGASEPGASSASGASDVGSSSAGSSSGTGSSGVTAEPPPSSGSSGGDSAPTR